MKSYIRMPVKLSQSTRLQCYNRCSQGGSNGEIARIHNSQGTSASRRRGDFLLRKVVHVGAVAFEFAVWARDFLIRDLFLQDVRGRRRDVIENGCIDAEILSQDRLGGMDNPIVDGKGCALLFR